MRSITGAVLLSMVLLTLGAAPSVSTPPGTLSDVVSAGDLDGDGRGDILELRRVDGDPPLVEAITTLAIARQADGTELFRTELPAGLLDVVPARVGDATGQGLLVTSLTGYGVIASSVIGRGFERPGGVFDVGADFDLTLHAVDAAGDVLWSRPFADGAFVYTGTTLNLVRGGAIPGGTGDADGDGTTDSVVGVYERTPTVDAQDDTLTIVVVSGADGSTISSATVDVSSTPAPVTVPGDLDGDGGLDYVVHLETPGVVEAHDGLSGEILWEATGLSQDLQRHDVTRTVGDLNDDGITELLLAGTASSVAEPAGSPPHAVVIDGATGTEQWRVVADAAFGVTDSREAVGAHPSAVVVVDSFVTAETIATRFRHLDRTGAVANETVVAADRVGSTSSGGLLARPGDVDGDGVADHHVRLTSSASGGVSNTTEATISGATLAATPTVVTDGSRLSANTDGTGDDRYVRADWGERADELTVVDGANGATRWTRRFHATGRDPTAGMLALGDLTGDGREDVLVKMGSTRLDVTDLHVAVVGGSPRTTDAFVLDGATGTVLWAAQPDPEPVLDRTERVSTDAPFEWQSAPTTSSWLAGDATCETQDEGHVCERIHLQVVPNDGQAFGRLTVHIGDFGPVPAPVTDLDLYLYESDEAGHVGPRLDVSGRYGLPDEPPGEDVEADLTFVEGGARYVVVEVRHYQSTQSTYTGTASLGDAD